MDADALETYLNDHLAGATLGCRHAQGLVERNYGTPLGTTMAQIAAEIEQDRDALEQLMEQLGASKDALKTIAGRVSEIAGRLKFSGLTSGDRDLGDYEALEALSLGVEGKRSLWTCLQRIAGGRPELATLDLEDLIARAESQRERLEAERLAAAGTAFG